MYGGVSRFMKSSGNALELRNTSLTHQHCVGSPPASVKRANKSRPFKQWWQAQFSQVRSDMRNAILRENNSSHISSYCAVFLPAFEVKNWLIYQQAYFDFHNMSLEWRYLKRLLARNDDECQCASFYHEQQDFLLLQSLFDCLPW